MIDAAAKMNARGACGGIRSPNATPMPCKKQ
jgi:hypothetical protein